MEQIRKAYRGTGKRGTSGKRDCHNASIRNLNVSIRNFLWQFVPVRDYSNAERRLEAMGFAPLLVNLESMASKPNAGGGNKDCVSWKVE